MWFRKNKGLAGPKEPSFPTQQLVVLALCRVCEPIAFMSIFPYVYFMVDYFRVAKDERGIAMYAGMITSSFAITEFATGMLWGRISDRFGRKPILISGLAGTGISMLVFGFAPNIWTALIARALGGLLNGNIGVINTTVAEIITHKKHQPRAFSIMPGVWCIGSIIGAALGGTLADPVRNYPGRFNPDGIFGRFPYLLPNLVCCGVVLFSMTVGILFLRETHEDKKNRRDRGVELGNWLLRAGHPSESVNEKVALMNGDYESVRTSDSRESIDRSVSDIHSSAISNASAIDLSEVEPKSLEDGLEPCNVTKGGITKAFTRQVMTIIVCYGFLAFHTITAEQLLPIMLSLPHSSRPPRLPFLFDGGFEMSTKRVGTILSSQGIVQAIAGIIVFPILSRKFGPLRVFRFTFILYPIFYLLVPYVTVLPEALRMPLLYVIIVWKVSLQAFALPPIHILLANSAPSKKVLGTLNGTAASSASLCRAMGPTISGLIQSAGLSLGCLALPWWTSSAVALVGLLLSSTLKEPEGQGEDTRATASSQAVEEEI